MQHVLVVDNSIEDCRALENLLTKDQEYSVSFAADAQSALENLQQHRSDAVLLDVAVPGLVDVSFVDRVKEDFPQTPVLIVSTKGHEIETIRALQQGASSYVPKDVLADELMPTLRDVLEYSKQQDCHLRMLAQMVELQCKFVLENDRSLIPPLVGYLQEHLGRVGVCGPSELMRVGIALDEALVNALYHGNLEMDSELREEGNAYHRLAEQRMQQPPYADRRLHVEVLISHEVAEFLIRDDGPGFDPSTLPDPTYPSNLDKVSGRGVLLMQTFMDEVVFNERGNGVILRKYRVPATGK